jgi:PilZ domain
MADPYCPRCRSEDVERVSREGWFERLLSIVYVYPFRCRACLRRFLAFRWGQRYVRRRRERRRDERWPVDFWTTLWLEAGGHAGRVRDLSASGLALETQAELPPGQHLELDLQPGPGERPIRVEVAVVRTIQSGRVGLQLVRVKDESDERLRKFLTGRAGNVRPGSSDE